MGYQIAINTAVNLSNDLRKSKRRVIFTHGAFDLFHAGHSLFLNKSKPKNSILIVGLEPDSNIKLYKSKLRPIIPSVQRIEILKNHVAVDFVFMIQELERCVDEYYLDLYKYIKPAVITFGKNFLVKNRVDQKIKGVRFQQINAEISSTTKIITSIIKKYKNSSEII